MAFSAATQTATLYLSHALPDDYYQVTIHSAGILDSAGNVLAGGVDQTSTPLGIVDSPATVGSVLESASDTGVSNSDGLTQSRTPAIDVTVNKRGTIDVDFDGDGQYDVSLAVNAAGTYVLTPASPLADGQHIVTSRFTPWVGQQAFTTLALTVDTVSPTLVNVNQGAALLFNGTSTLVTMGDMPAMVMTRTLTLEAWIYPRSDTTGVIAGKDGQYLLPRASNEHVYWSFAGTGSPGWGYSDTGVVAPLRHL